MEERFSLLKKNKYLVGEGRVQLCFIDGRVETLNDVLHILGNVKNLLKSISNLNNYCVYVTFKNFGYSLMRENFCWHCVVIDGNRYRRMQPVWESVDITVIDVNQHCDIIDDHWYIS